VMPPLVIARRVSAEAIQSLSAGNILDRRSRLLRGACHPAALRADRLARNDGLTPPARSCPRPRQSRRDSRRPGTSRA
jgi:hypothetical protein